MSDTAQELCPAELISQLIEELDGPKGMDRLSAAMERYPDDPRLPFLKGSLLAGKGDYASAHSHMLRAVEIAPGYRIARFQLGLLELSSGDAEKAGETWAPLAAEMPQDSLSLFARGLQHMARDEFAPAAELLESGLEANHEHPAVGRDMAGLLSEIRAKLMPDDLPDGEVSLTQMLLRQSDKTSQT